MARTRSPDLSGRLTRVLGAIHGAHSHFFLNTFWAATTRVFSIFQIIVWGNNCEVRRPLLYRAEGRAVPELITYRDVGRLAVSLKGKGIDDRREPWWCARLSAHGAAGSRRPIQVASIWIRSADDIIHTRTRTLGFQRADGIGGRFFLYDKAGKVHPRFTCQWMVTGHQCNVRGFAFFSLEGGTGLPAVKRAHSTQPIFSTRQTLS
ncbi:hypothetical protein F5141DRAFT_1243506 [Pisolithus sp. B1]|nr:hypothetical protein F5141DRAFT_1243506 [Pisolithus sp. B1]